MTNRTMTTPTNQMTSEDKAWAKCYAKKQAAEAALVVFETTRTDEDLLNWQLANAAYKRSLKAYFKAKAAK